jgi:hypothetical protein
MEVEGGGGGSRTMQLSGPWLTLAPADPEDAAAYKAAMQISVFFKEPGKDSATRT